MSDNSPKNQGTTNFMASIDQFFQSTFKHFPTQLFGQAIPVRVKEESNEFIIEADLPGVKREQIELEAHHQALIIRLQNVDELMTLDEESNLISRQSSNIRKERVIPVPFPFQDHDIHAHYQDGLLRIKITGHRKTIAIK